MIEEFEHPELVHASLVKPCYVMEIQDSDKYTTNALNTF